MTGYLKQQAPFVQFVAFLGLYLGCSLLYYLLLMNGFLSQVAHISPAEMQQGDLGDPRVLNGLKIMQLLYTIGCFLLPAALFTYLSSERPLRYVGLKGNIRPSLLVLSILVLLVSLPMVGVLSDWNHLVHFPEAVDQTFRALEDKAAELTKALLDMPGPGALLYNLVLIALLPAIAEEWFFRGALQRIFIRMTGKGWAGIVIAAAIFSLLHLEMFGFFPRMVLGIILGCIYYFSGNLWLAMVAHFVNNALQIVLVYLYQHHLTGYNIMVEKSTPLVAGLVSLLLVTGLFILFRKLAVQKTVNEHLPEEAEK